jgi:hypothetical protein
MCHLAVCCTFLCMGSSRVSHGFLLSVMVFLSVLFSVMVFLSVMVSFFFSHGFCLSFMFVSHGFLFVNNAPAGHSSHVLDPSSSW